jgi:4-aminobutyrate aminotransferase-like enzyme
MSDPAIELLLSRRRRTLGHPTPLFYDEPLHLVRGEGVWLFDHEGRRYLDAYNNVPHVGHCHPHVVDALHRQAAKLNVHTRYLHENVVCYGERLTATFDPLLSTVLFVCTGTEANELALRIARHHTGARGILVTDFSYHGNSATLASIATGIQTNEPFPPHARVLRIPDVLRDLADGGTPEQLAERALAEADAAIAALQRTGYGVAALLLDTIFSTEGLSRLPPGYLEQLVARVRAAGGLFIADEVQPGFGRTGEHFWGYQSYEVVPDFVTLGKPMGNGHPIGAAITRPELANAFLEDAMFFNTFAGNPVSAAVGLAVLDVIERQQLVRNAHDTGEYLQQRLWELAQRHERVIAVRGKGLFFGLELVSDRRTRAPATTQTRRLVNDIRRRGVLISAIGHHGNVLKMRPPMVFEPEHADLLLTTLDEALGALR